MKITGNCKLVVEGDIVQVVKLYENGLFLRTESNQEILLTEQGYRKVEEFFMSRRNTKNDPDIDQLTKDLIRENYCKGYDDGYNVGTSMKVD